jgi:anthranilate synthase component 2
MILLLDNFDSFSHMLADLIRQTGEELIVVRNDVLLEEMEKLKFDGLVLSPGPGIPSQAGNMNTILSRYHREIPILGVCLGHQAIGEFFGAKLVKNSVPTHGKVRAVRKVGTHYYTESLPSQFNVTRYHSLFLTDVPEDLKVILESETKEIMGIVHRKFPILGIQYHPEAYLTEWGLELVSRWVKSIKLAKAG